MLAFFLAGILIMGVPPLPDRPELLVDLLGEALTLSLCMWVLIRKAQVLEASQPINIYNPSHAI